MTRQNPAARRRWLFASGAGLGAAVLIIAIAALGALTGPLPIVGFALAWILLPSAARLSRRLALNGAIGLSVIPILWWFPFPSIGHVGHVAVTLALLIGALGFLVVFSESPWRSILPRVAPTDAVTLAALIASVWYFLPFFRNRIGVPAVAQLMQGFGGDNVAHFDMFEMIRRFQIAGPGWPAPPGGGHYAYVEYPQQFHVLAAFAAEVWHGTAIGSSSTEAGLFQVGTGLILSIAVTILVAAITSLAVFRRRPGLVLVAAVSAFSFLLLGMGANTLSFGFPGYFLAIVGVSTCLVLARSGGVTRQAGLIASAGLVVLVAQSWSLLTPIALIGLAVTIAALPLRRFRKEPRTAVPSLIVVAAAIGAVGYTAALVFVATAAAGSPEAALATAGGFPVTSVTLPFALALILIGLSFARLGGSTASARRLRQWSAEMVVGLAAIVALGVGVALIVIQLRRAADLEYFQFKFLFAMTLILLTVLPIEVLSWLPRGSGADGAAHRRVARGVASIALCVGIVTLSGIPFAPKPSLQTLVYPGLQFRHYLQAEAAAPKPGTARVMVAADMMAAAPCDRPIYFAALDDDTPVDQANQWAMSLSSTWTIEAGPITSFIYENDPHKPGSDDAATVTRLLDGHPDRCIIVAPRVFEKLPATTRSTFSSQLVQLNGAG